MRVPDSDSRPSNKLHHSEDIMVQTKRDEPLLLSATTVRAFVYT